MRPNKTSNKTPRKAKPLARKKPVDTVKKRSFLKALKRCLPLLPKVFLLGLVGLLFVVVYLDALVTDKFDGNKWSLPAKVYGRPLELYAGKVLAPEQLLFELNQLGYREVKQPVARSGQYQQAGNYMTVYTRPFHFADQFEAATKISVQWQREDQHIKIVTLRKAGQAIPYLRLEPQLIGGIYPSHNEDRQLIQLDDLPHNFVPLLLAIEDRNYYQHLGVSPWAIARAAWANLSAGQIKQGGSTLTQQLVKNFYLNSQQTLLRKGIEAIMALLLESHYSKDEILAAYINEVFLGQQGKRAIHGFGQASQYFFGQPINELQLHQMALLVGMVKGPSYYNPKRHPQRAKQRRNLVLDVLAQQGIISQRQKAASQAMPLGLSQVAQLSNYPAYLDALRQQLQENYPIQALREQGLRIFSTISPWVQYHADKIMRQGLQGFINNQPNHASLQGALVLSKRSNGDVLALVGDKDGGYASHNWALDQSRQIGSLIKPVIHLQALETGPYQLLSPLDDGPLQVPLDNGDIWEPQNYDKLHHGGEYPNPNYPSQPILPNLGTSNQELPYQVAPYQVSMLDALTQSYNIANVRLGLELGVESVLERLSLLGADKNIAPYPSRLLGALELSPLKVNQVYQTLANQGFYTPLSMVRQVTDATGDLLSRYPYKIKQGASAEATYLLNAALAQVTQEGTGKGVYRYLPSKQTVAGKTGTTNNKRDSWFAGFSGDYVATVWVGNADASATALTGATGALPLWAQLISKLPYQPQTDNPPDTIKFYNTHSGYLVPSQCQGRVLPFNQALPKAQSQCSY